MRRSSRRKPSPTQACSSPTGSSQKLFYEIPSREIGKEYLLVTSQAKTQAGVGYGGDSLNYQVVRWDRSADRIVLRSVPYASVAPDSLPVYYAVEKRISLPS